MNQIQFIPKANRPSGSKIVDLVDKEPWSDIMDRKEDRELYPDDWMKKIFLDQEHYDDLLSLLEPQLKIAVPLIHPNKLLRTTLRHLVEGDTCTDAQEPAVILVGQVIQFVLQSDYQIPTEAQQFLEIAANFEDICGVPHCMGAFAGRQIKSKHFDIFLPCSDGQWSKGDGFLICMVDARLKILYCISLAASNYTTFGEILSLADFATERKRPGYFPEAKPIVEGSHVKVPYTFVGGKQFPMTRYMRVPTSLNKKQNREIGRALVPAEIVMDMLLSRFGIFQVKHTSAMKKLSNCAILLHNYFLRTNPAYADLNQSRNGSKKLSGKATPVDVKVENCPN